MKSLCCIVIFFMIFISQAFGTYLGPIVIKNKEQASYSTPEEAVSAFFSANMAADLDWYYETLTTESVLQEKTDFHKSGLDPMSGINVFKNAFSSASIINSFEYLDTTVVLVKIVNIEGNAIELPYTLVKENGEWKITNKYAASEELVKYMKYDLKLFKGKGQRPVDVNSFLSYYEPKDSTTLLTPGITTFDLQVFYGASIMPLSFSASLNGKDISADFSPIPSGNQVVTLRLESGRNVLLLSVEGERVDGKTARDEDRLVFVVQEVENR